MTAPVVAANPTLGEIAPKAHADAGQGHREKVKKYYGDRYPMPDDDQEKAIRYIKDLRTAGDLDRWARYRQMTQNMLYAYGSQNLTWRKSLKQWEELPLTLADGTQRVVMNYILPVLRARSQRLMAGPVQFNALPPSTSLEARDQAKIFVNLVQGRYQATNMREKTDQAFMLAFTGGAAFFKSFWNQEIGPQTPATMRRVRREPMLDDMGQPILDGAGMPIETIVRDPATNQPIIDEFFIGADGQPTESEQNAFFYRPGDTDTAVRSLFNVQVNPDAMGWDAGSGLRWLIDVDLVAMERARALFPDKCEHMKKASADAVGMTLERLAAGSATARTMYGLSASTGSSGQSLEGSAEIVEYWQLPDECFPTGRLITTAGEQRTFDDGFPQGIFPYRPLFDEPAPLTPLGRPCVNDMKSPQDTINEQWTAIRAEFRNFGFARWAAFDIPGLPEQLSAGEDSTVIRVPLRSQLARRSLRDAFHRLEPGSVGGDRWKAIAEAKSALYDVGAYHEVSRGQVPPGVDSGVAIEHLRDEEKAQLLKAVHAYEQTLIGWAKDQGAIARWGYADDVERWIPVDRPDLGVILETVTGKQLPDPESLTVSLEGFNRSTSAAGFRTEVKEAIDKKWIDPRKGLQLLDMGQGLTPAMDSETRHYARARKINLAIQKSVDQESAEITIQPPQPMLDPETQQPLIDPASPDGEPLMENAKAIFTSDGTDVVLPQDDDHLIHLMVLDELALDLTQPPRVRELAQAIKAERRNILNPPLAPAAPPA